MNDTEIPVTLNGVTVGKAVVQSDGTAIVEIENESVSEILGASHISGLTLTSAEPEEVVGDDSYGPSE